MTTPRTFEATDDGSTPPSAQPSVERMRHRYAAAAERYASLRGMFAIEGRTLLQMLFAWRRQGSISRWHTGPSKALALYADHLEREWPDAVKASQTIDADFTPPPEPIDAEWCAYEGCDQEATCTLPGATRMCSHHAAVSLLASMTSEDARSTFRFARPVPEDPWALLGEVADRVGIPWGTGNLHSRVRAAARGAVPADPGTQGSTDPSCPYCVSGPCPDHQPLRAEPELSSDPYYVINPSDYAELGKRDWFFTFGSGHELEGASLGSRFVRIHGTAGSARSKMIDHFGMRWSHQYATEEAAGVQQFGLTELPLPKEPRDG